MGGFETVLELALVVLLTTTLFYAIRLHRSISALRGDRSGLDAAVAVFDTGTRQAEQGLRRLREEAGNVSDKLDELTALKDDLVVLTERGGVVADRLDSLVRAARTIEAAGAQPPGAPIRSQAERDLLLALREVR